jgi:hypothetical protein
VLKSGGLVGEREVCQKPPLQYHLALPHPAASILGAFRRILSIFIALSLLDTCAAGSVQQVVAHR